MFVVDIILLRPIAKTYISFFKIVEFKKKSETCPKTLFILIFLKLKTNIIGLHFNDLLLFF